jgi:AraC-like DNA-binding protein
MGRRLLAWAATVLDFGARFYHQSMLHARQLLTRDGITIADVACHHGMGRGEAELNDGGHRLVLVRRGCFLREISGVTCVLDPTMGYFINPGDEHRIDHPQPHGDDCTAVGLSVELAASLWGGNPSLPRRPVSVSPRLDLEHRLLLAAARRGVDSHELEERAIVLSAALLEQTDPRRVGAGRPSTQRARRALADGVREALTADPGRSLPELAHDLAVSPHHLSRVFHSVTGHTISRHRMRLRVRAALERLAGGERNLARLAAELGFADQGHLCRVVKAETARTPSALRSALA